MRTMSPCCLTVYAKSPGLAMERMQWSGGILGQRIAAVNIPETDCCEEAVEFAGIRLTLLEKWIYFGTFGRVMLSGGRPVACDRADAVEASLLAPHSFIPGYQSLLKSTQCGFTDSIKTIFFSRRQPLSCFSRPIALCMSS